MKGRLVNEDETAILKNLIKRRDKLQKELMKLTTKIQKIEDKREGYGEVVEGFKCFKCGNSIIKIRALPYDLWKCKKCGDIMNPFNYMRNYYMQD